jgi:hypothetical protein
VGLARTIVAMDRTGAAPREPVAVPPHLLAEQYEALRRAWQEVALEVVPNSEGLRDLLDARLSGLEPTGVPTESALLTVAEDAAQVALQSTTADDARTLSKRLRRAVYEFLLGIDATAAAMAHGPAAAVAVVPPSDRKSNV